MFDHQLDGVVGEPGAVFDAVDSRRDQSGQRVLAEDVRGDSRTVGVGGVDRCGQHVVGPQRRQIAYAAVDPVADQLDPAVTALRLQGHRVGELCLVFDVDR
jgi:hypothetical protein